LFSCNVCTCNSFCASLSDLLLLLLHRLLLLCLLLNRSGLLNWGGGNGLLSGDSVDLLFLLLDLGLNLNLDFGGSGLIFCHF